MDTKTLLTTAIAMIAFAANSILCRLALGQETIDAASFASIRVIAGALVLGVIVFPRWRVQGRAKADWRTVAALFVYMAFFAFAYLSLSTGTGALLLFGSVQLSVPVIAALGGLVFLSEEVSLRLVLASVATLSGITLVLIQREVSVVNKRY